MPTIRRNIKYLYESRVLPRRSLLAHIGKVAATILLIAFLLETFVFNMNYFLSMNYNTIDLSDALTLQETSDEQYKITEVDNVIEFSNLNTEVHNVHLQFDWTQPAQNLTFKVQFTDDAHHTYFDSTEYTVGVPDVDISTMVSESQYLNLKTSGRVDNLRIELVGNEDTSYPVRLTRLELNAHRAFTFNFVRFGGVAIILALTYLFRPGSSIYRVSIRRRPRESKAGIVTAVVIEVALVSSFLFMGSNLVGVATSNYNSGSWDGHSLVNAFEVGGDNAQQYAELAKSMSEGKLYLEEEPPEWLQQMSDPYDKGARDELQKETGESYLFDVAYYDGHYYVYFGVVPVLLFYLPFYLATGVNFPTAIGVLLAAIAFILGCSALLDRFARYHFKQVSLGLYLLLQIVLVSCCGILYLIKFPTFYSLPIMCGLAFSVWGLYFWMCGRGSSRPCGWYLAGSFCMALVAGCRPQLLVLSLLAFPLFWRPYITERKLFTKHGAREFACLIAPYLVVAAGIMLYNHARFGSFTDFGANYNLTVNDMTKRGVNFGRLAPALFAYFLQPPCVTGTFPYLQAAPFDTTYLGQTIKEVTFGGVLACLPVLWLLPFAPRILRLRISQRSTRTILGVIVVLLATGVLVALVDAEMAGILQRYYADFSFMLLAAVVLLAFIVNENLAPGSAMAQIFTKVLLALVAISVLYSVLVCFVPETGWYSDIYPWAYQSLIEMVEFWT